MEAVIAWGVNKFANCYVSMVVVVLGQIISTSRSVQQDLDKGDEEQDFSAWKRVACSCEEFQNCALDIVIIHGCKLDIAIMMYACTLM